MDPFLNFRYGGTMRDGTFLNWRYGGFGSMKPGDINFPGLPTPSFMGPTGTFIVEIPGQGDYCIVTMRRCGTCGFTYDAHKGHICSGP